MRHLHLYRTRTNAPLTISLDLYQSPLILYHQDQHIDPSSSEQNHLGFAVNVSSSSSVGNGIAGSSTGKQIGGIVVIRRVLLRRKIPKTKHWGPWEELQNQEIQVCGPMLLIGKKRFECTMPLGARIPETRETHYDQLVHTLTAIIQDVPPGYDVSPAQLRISRFHARSQVSSLSRPQTPQSSPSASAIDLSQTRLTAVQENEEPLDFRSSESITTGLPGGMAIACCKRIIQVVHCPSAPGDVPRLDNEQSIRLCDSGKASIKLSSDLFVLGSTMDVMIDINGLTPDTTIHAISVSLIQETITPVKNELPDLDNFQVRTPATTTPAVVPPLVAIPGRSRSRSRAVSDPVVSSNGEQPRRNRRPMLSRLSTMWAAFKEKPPTPQSSILDDYTLLTEGMDHYILPTGFGARPNTYIWRGSAGRAIDQQHGPSTLPGETEYLDDSKALDPLSPGTLPAHMDTFHHTETSDSTKVEKLTSRLRITRKVRIPSSVLGAHHSSTTLSPFLAKVIHRISVDIIYSILGQDSLGKPLSHGSKAEGSPRQGKSVIEVGLAPCCIIQSTIQPPEYICPTQSPRKPRRSSSVHSNSGQHGVFRRRWSNSSTSRASIRSFESAGTRAKSPSATTGGTKSVMGEHSGEMIPHSRAFCASNGLVVASKKVFYDDLEVKQLVGKHLRDQTACACTVVS